MVKPSMLSIAQLVLLLCAWGVQTQDFLTPALNILNEIAKIKNLEARLNTTEDTVQIQNSLVTELTSVVEQLKSENDGTSLIL